MALYSGGALAEPRVIGEIFDADPYLAYQPPFAYSLPIQLFIYGITLTLLAVLLIHLLFTTQYHYPLAPLNYCLQLASIIVVLISVIVKIAEVLKHCAFSSDHWPYALDYVSVPIPPEDWSMAQDAAWFLLQALNSALANLTHIQFLTLLFPSRLETRLIFFILGPLAIVASALTFTALSPMQTVLDLGDAIRNVFNSTLLLIFTISLAIWGFFVNRRRAWRLDGGTGIFGFGAMFLAVITTSFNFVAVKEDGIEWLQHLLYAAVLWQTWLGWWWWVGSGMGIGEVEDLMERAEKRKRKQAKKASRLRASKASSGMGRKRSASLLNVAESSANAMVGFTSSVAGILRNRGNSLVRRRTSMSANDAREVEDGRLASSGPAIEMDDLGATNSNPNARTSSVPVPRAPGSADRSTASHPRVAFSSSSNPGTRHGGVQSTTSETDSTSQTPSLHPPRHLGEVFTYPLTWFHVSLRRLRRAHEEAAKREALSQAHVRQKVFTAQHGQEPRGPVRSADEEIGWGLGSFGIKEHRESAKRLQRAGEQLRENRLLPDQPEVDEGLDENGAGPSTRREPAVEREAEPDNAERLVEEGEPAREPDGEWEDVENTTTTESDPPAAHVSRRGRRADNNTARPNGWSWWGPLRDWRLGDRSVF